MKTEIRFLSQEDKDQIHDQTLSILAKTGVMVQTAKGRDILKQAGADVNDHSQIVLFPKTLVEQSIRQAPQQFKLGARRNERDFHLGQGHSTLCMTGEGTTVIDRQTGEYRDSIYQDLLDVTQLADAIDEIGIYWRTVTPSDMGNRMSDFVTYAINVFRNFSKHVQDPFHSPQQAPWILEILQVIFGDKEAIRTNHPFSMLMCPQSPLIISDVLTDAILALKGWNVPVAVMPMALMGATAPASMMGTLIQCNCEVLASLCLLQANEPGVPFIYAPVPTLMDPRSCRYYCGGVENGMMNAAAVEMAKYYKFPVIASGFGTDSFAPSIQSGMERSLNAVLPAAAHPDILIGPGLFGGDMILNFEQIILDVETYRNTQQIKRGLKSTDFNWSEAAISETGPGGNYLTHHSTAKNIRSGNWYLPQLGVHSSFEKWEAEKQQSLVEEARSQVDQILESYECLPFSKEVESELSRIVKSSQKVSESFKFV